MNKTHFNRRHVQTLKTVYKSGKPLLPVFKKLAIVIALFSVASLVFTIWLVVVIVKAIF